MYTKTTHLLILLCVLFVTSTGEIVSLNDDDVPSSSFVIANTTTYYPLSLGGTTPRNQLLRTLLEWLKTHGSYFPKVGVSASTSTGAGGFAVGNISRNEKFMKIPQNLIITPTRAAREVPALRDLQKRWTVTTLEESYNKDKVMIAFYLLWEVRRSGGWQQCSFFQPYLDSCPLHYDDFPLFWKQSDLDLLQASRLTHDVRNMNARHLRDFERACEVFKTLSSNTTETLDCDDMLLESPYYQQSWTKTTTTTTPLSTTFPSFMDTPPRSPNVVKHQQCGGWPSWGKRSLWSVYQWYKWARTVISSRSWRVYLRGKAQTDKSGKAPQCSYSSLALVPLADLLNHRNTPGTHWTFDVSSKSFVVKATKSHEMNGAIYDSYGLKKNSVFLLNFGFVSDNSAHEASMIFPPLDVKSIISKHQTMINAHGGNAPFSSVVVNAMEALDRARKSHWNYEHRRHTVTLTLDDHAHNMLLQLRNVAPKLVGTPPHGWVGRAIMSVASASLELYDTTIREDQELLDKLNDRGMPVLTHWQRNAVKIRMGEKKILKSWLRFGKVVNHNFDIRPHRITVAITMDSSSSSTVLSVHSSTLLSLDQRESQDMYVGMPVFAQWGNEFYDGAIVAKYVKDSTKKNKKNNKATSKTEGKNDKDERSRLKDSYMVQFYDGDFKMSTPRDAIITFPESFMLSSEYEQAVRASAVEIPKALSGVCWIVTLGYWTYEVCVGHQIIQYHANQDGTRGNSIVLGRYVDVSSIVLNCNQHVKDASRTFSSSSSSSSSSWSASASKTCTETTSTYESNSRERSIYFEEESHHSSSSSDSSGSASGTSADNNYYQKSNDEEDSVNSDDGARFRSSSSAAHGRHAYRQMFRGGNEGRKAELVFVCRREKDSLARKRAQRGDSHSLDDLKGSPLRGHKIVRQYLHDDGNVRPTSWTELSTGQILHIDEPEMMNYRIVVGTEAACVGLKGTGSKLASDIRAVDEVSQTLWMQKQKIQTTTSSDSSALVSIEKNDVKDPLLYEHLSGHVMSVMTTTNGRQTWAKAYIKLADKTGTYKVTFDEHNMERNNVPLTEILPLPENLMKLPCWLFDEIPGESC
jgi:hypothetical protein